jgi:EAL domain-containing protein (putative c-di-GMP-specific phosphodiesterase class I)
VITLSVSVGVALAGPRSIPEELLRDADTAMYRAKELGRDRHHVFDDALHAEVTTRLTLENDLRTALARGELRVVYQPVIDLASGVTSGVEALLRWDHPVRGPIPPLQFIPLAEETGTILPIGRFVLQEACRQAVAWHEAGWPIQVAVNVSAYQIHNDGFVDDVATALERSGLESSFLCLELTETTLMTESTHTVHMLESLKRLGVRISIDDFGTGYSSLAYLQQFPVDEVKIDRAFVSNLPGPSEELTLVGAMVAMGQALRLNVVAEGVEQPAQVDELRRLGCDSAQGFLFAVPQSAEAVTYLLRRQNLRAVS